MLLVVGIFLALSIVTEDKHNVVKINGIEYQSTSAESIKDALSPVKFAENDATSYDDELQAHDDEVEQVNLDDDSLSQLPEEAQNALENLLDVADQAIRIKEQFSHTVVRGDTLKDVLELSGLEDDTAQKLTALYPELKKLEPGQQFYWILGKNNELEYLNWLVSQREERIYELEQGNNYTRRILEKKAFGKRKY